MENFILYEELSREDSCILYKGRKKNTIKFLAIKCADKYKKGEIANMVRLIHEIKHDNIVRFYEWYETAGHLWLMLELCIGGSLQLLIQKDGNLPEESIREFGIDLVEGLYHIHSLDIIYSDLQPSKILVSGSGRLKLGDFGLSRLENEDLNAVMSSLFNSDEFDENSPEEAPCLFPDAPKNLKSSGNPKYMAPEIISGGNHSFSSDLWSLGCVLYEMFSGIPTFSAGNFTLLKDKILNSDIMPPKSFHGSPTDCFLDLVHGLLNKRPQSRMKWTDVLTHPFWKGALNYHLQATATSIQTRTLNDCSQDAMKQIIRQSITNFKVHKEFKEKLEEDDGESDDTLTDEGDTVDESILRLKECNNDICKPRCSSLISEQKFSTRSGCERNKIKGDMPEAGCSEFIEIINLIFHPSDFLLSPVANLEKGLLKISSLKYDLKALAMDPIDIGKADEVEIKNHLKYLTDVMLSVASHKGNPAPQKLVQLLNYIGSISHNNSFISNHCISLKILSHLAKQSRDSGQVEMKFKLCQVFSVIISNSTALDANIDLSEALSCLVDAAREHSKNQKLKTTYLATIGDLLALIAKQEQLMEQKNITWLVPPTVYSFISKCLTEGEDLISNLYAARIIANVAASRSNHIQRFLGIDVCNNLWLIYLHGTTEFIKIAAITALSRLSRYNISIALNLFEKHGISQYLQAMNSTSTKLLQPGVTLMILILLSDARPSKWLFEKEPLWFLMRLLESSVTVVRAKAYLGVLEIIIFSNDQLLYVCQNKFLLMVEKDLRKISSETTSKTIRYLDDCLSLVINRLVDKIPIIFSEVMSSIEVIQGRKYLTHLQQKQLKYSLPLLQIIQHFINSSVFRPKIISKSFLRNLSKLYEFLTVMQSSILQISIVLGVQNYEEFIQTTFGCSEFILLHCDMMGDHVDIIINNILSHLFSLITCSSGDLRSMSMRFFCEACIMLLSSDTTFAKPQIKCLERLLDGFIASVGDIIVESEMCLPYALRLTKEVLNKKPYFSRNLEGSNLIPVLFQVVYSHHGNIMCGAVENVLSILKCFISSREADLRNLFHMGFTQFFNYIFLESNLFHVSLHHDNCDDTSPSGQSDTFILEVLDLFNMLMKRLSEVVRIALEAKKAGHKISSGAAEAKDLLMLNKSFLAFMTPLSHLLIHKDKEISEESLKCLGLLIQFYGGENEDSLSVENQICFNEYLKRGDAKKQKIMLRLIKRLITTKQENDSSITLANTPLLSTIQEIALSVQSCSDKGICDIAREILEAIRNPHTND